MLDRATTLIPKMSVAIENLQQRVDKLVQSVRVFEQTNTHTHTKQKQQQENTLLPIMNKVNTKLDEILEKIQSNANNNKQKKRKKKRRKKEEEASFFDENFSDVIKKAKRKKKDRQNDYLKNRTRNTQSESDEWL